MGSQKRRSRRKRSLLPRFSTIALLLVLGAAGYFFYQMKLVKEDRDGQELDQYEEGLVDNKLKPMVNAINEALAKEDVTPQNAASEMKKQLDSIYISNLDTFLLRDNRYAHFRNALDEQLVLPRVKRQGDSVIVEDAEKMVQLLEEYKKVEKHVVADSCLSITKDLIKNKK